MANGYRAFCIYCGELTVLTTASTLDNGDLIPWKCNACDTEQAFSPNAQTKLSEF